MSKFKTLTKTQAPQRSPDSIQAPARRSEAAKESKDQLDLSSPSVPEIQNEIPSDQELAAYLEARLAESALAMIDPSEVAHRFLHPSAAEALIYLTSSDMAPEFRRTAKEALLQSLLRLNRLPRTEPFWDNTNLRPTVSKVGLYCEALLTANPHDVVSHWALFALTLVHSGNFDHEGWRKLEREGALPLEMAMFAAMFLVIAAGSGPEDFSEYVKAVGRAAEAMPLLNQVKQNGGRFLAEWSQAVIDSLRPPGVS